MSHDALLEAPITYYNKLCGTTGRGELGTIGETIGEYSV